MARDEIPRRAVLDLRQREAYGRGVMIEKDDGLKVPPWNTRVWRYMSLDKFLSIVQSSQLHFTNANLLTDQYEGTTPSGTIAHLTRVMKSQGRDQGDIEARLLYISQEAAAAKSNCWINCWSIGRFESYALWKIYLGGSTAGVAIQTNVKRLTNAINLASAPLDPPVMIGRVDYTNHIRPEWAIDWKLLTAKSPFYVYENELRLFIVANWNAPSVLGTEPHTGVKVAVDLDTLIERLYVSPFCGAWFHESFKALLIKLKPFLSDRVVPSRVRDR